MNDWMSPDHDKGQMARFLDELDRSHSVSLPKNIREVVDRELAHVAEVSATRARWAQAAQDDAAKKQAVLDADVKILVRGDKCQAEINTSRFRTTSCHKFASVVRTWTSREYRSRPTGHDAGIFCDCPDGEHRETTGSYEPVEHTMALCGTHRKIKGQYGFPY